MRRTSCGSRRISQVKRNFIYKEKINMAVFRIYAEKKPEFAVEASSILSDIRTSLRLDVKGIRVLNR